MKLTQLHTFAAQFEPVNLHFGSAALCTFCGQYKCKSQIFTYVLKLNYEWLKNLKIRCR